MNFCPHCGKAYEGEFAFCPYCGRGLPMTAQQTMPPQPPHPVVQSATPQGKSHTGRNIAILFVLLLLFFLLPVVPYTFASYSFLGGNAQATGDVSMSFALFHCGMVVNVQATGSFAGYTIESYSAGNPGWVCNGSG